MIVRCLHCGGEASAIASVDQYTATCRGEVTIDKNRELEFEPAGYTEIDWDSCDQIGWQCLNCLAEEIAPVDKDGEREPLDKTLRRLVKVVIA